MIFKNGGRRTFLYRFLLLFVAGCLAAGWDVDDIGAEKILEPAGIRENIFGSAVITETDYVLVGGRGKIFRSRDSGRTWREIASGTRKTLYAVCFSDNENGWISGQSGTVLHTGDGGKSWEIQKSGTKKHLFGISFANSRHGCAVGDWSIILTTNDGGATWRDASLTEDVLLYDVDMSDRLNGCAVGEFGNVYITADGGTTWEKVPSPASEGVSLFCMNRHKEFLYAGGLDGLLLYSRNNGRSWSRADSSANKSIYGISVNGSEGWAVGDAGTVLMTGDSGMTWQTVDVPEMLKLFWLKAVRIHNSDPRDLRGFITGANGQYFNIKKQHIVW